MRLLLFLFSLFFVSLSIKAQSLKGKVYDGITTVKGIKVFNETQNRLTATDENGNFRIQAKVNDTISFESLFHHPKSIVLNTSHFSETAVFELKKIVNELDEVEIKAEPEQPVFTQETYNLELQNLIKEDIKNNPHLYKPAGATYGVDIFYLIGQLAKLFKSNKIKPIDYKPIKYRQFDSLFNNSAMFNKKLITKNLNIPEDKIYLFYDFCEAKQLSSELLQENKKMQLLEQLVLNSQLFLILLEQYGSNKISKD